MTERPPSGSPQILHEKVFTADDPLVVSSANAASPAGAPLLDRALRDVIVDCQVRLIRGHPTTTFGMYLRQTRPDLYLLWTLTPERRFRVGAVDGSYKPVADGPLLASVPLDTTRPVRLRTVAVGPSLTMLVGDQIITGVTVDLSYAQGITGVWLQAGSGEGAELAVDWVQIRAIFPND